MNSTLFGNFSSKEERQKIRSKSIAMLKSTKAKTLNPQCLNPKTNIISRIYTQEALPGLLSKNLIESISPKYLNLSKLNNTTKVEKLQKTPQRSFVSAKSDAIIKKNVYKKRSIIASARKKGLIDDNPSICIEEPSCSTLITNYTVATCKSAVCNDSSKYRSKFLSTSQLDNPSNNHSFHSQDSVKSEFKSKLLIIFTNFKNTHLEILKKYKKV